MEFKDVINFLKKLENRCEIYVSYTYINGIEFEFDILSNLDLNKVIRGYDMESNDVIDVNLKEYISNNNVDSLSFEVQVPCDFEDDFLEIILNEGVSHKYYETYLAPDCASRDYSVYSINIKGRGNNDG